MSQLKIEQLIESGAHFGHPVSKWNPKFKKFIISKKNGIHIIDLNLTLNYLERAVGELRKIVNSNGNILFVGTKKQAKDIVREYSDKTGMFYIVERWLGGTLTNFATIKKSIRRLKILEKETSAIFKDITKKERSMLERERLKLSDLHRGIKDMRHLPSALFVVDAKHEKISIAEAKCLGIPTFGIVDSNTDPDILDFPIPANDDSIKTIRLIISYISSSLIETMPGNNMKEDSKENNNASQNAENQNNKEQ